MDRWCKKGELKLRIEQGQTVLNGDNERALLRILHQVQNKRKQLGFQTITESSVEYHHDTNPMAEVFNRVFAAQIRTHIITSKKTWGNCHQDMFMLTGLHVTYHTYEKGFIELG